MRHVTCTRCHRQHEAQAANGDRVVMISCACGERIFPWRMDPRTGRSDAATVSDVLHRTCRRPRGRFAKKPIRPPDS